MRTLKLAKGDNTEARNTNAFSCVLLVVAVLLLLVLLFVCAIYAPASVCARVSVFAPVCLCICVCVCCLLV